MMNLDFYIQSFLSNRETFKMLLSGLDIEQIKWKPSEIKWNLLEVVCHLYDEEREDFKYRIKHILKDPSVPLPPIDPVGWVISRNYSEQDFDTMLTKFMDERTESVNWLGSLVEPNWDQTYIHPKIGPISAGLMLANWLAHDYLHFRQIAKLKYEYLEHLSSKDLSYAGNW